MSSMSATSPPDLATIPTMSAAPQGPHPGVAPPQGEDTAGRVVRVLGGVGVAVAWGIGAMGVGLFAALMLAFASDAGLPSPDLQEAAFGWALAGIGVVGLAGIGFGWALAWPPHKRTALRAGIVVLGVGAAITICAVVVYFVPFSTG